jgi:hypothetical protein
MPKKNNKRKSNKQSNNEKNNRSAKRSKSEESPTPLLLTMRYYKKGSRQPADSYMAKIFTNGSVKQLRAEDKTQIWQEAPRISVKSWIEQLPIDEPWGDVVYEPAPSLSAQAQKRAQQIQQLINARKQAAIASAQAAPARTSLLAPRAPSQPLSQGLPSMTRAQRLQLEEQITSKGMQLITPEQQRAINERIPQSHKKGLPFSKENQIFIQGERASSAAASKAATPAAGESAAGLISRGLISTQAARQPLLQMNNNSVAVEEEENQLFAQPAFSSSSSSSSSSVCLGLPSAVASRAFSKDNLHQLIRELLVNLSTAEAIHVNDSKRAPSARVSSVKSYSESSRQQMIQEAQRFAQEAKRGICHANNDLSALFEKIREQTTHETVSSPLENHERIKDHIKRLLANTSVPERRHSVEKLLESPDPKYKRLQAYYVIAEFLRSYIDCHHDFKQLAKGITDPSSLWFKMVKMEQMMDEIKAMQNSDNSKRALMDELISWYRKWMNTINSSIYTAVRGVNNNACINVLSDMVDDLLYKVHDDVKWIPRTQKQGFVKEFKFKSVEKTGRERNEYRKEKYDFVEELHATLWEKGVRSCFAESVMGGFYDFLLEVKRDPNVNFNQTRSIRNEPEYLINRMMRIAEWDAANVSKKHNTGISFAPLLHSIFPDIIFRKILPVFGGAICVVVSPDNNTLECSINFLRGDDNRVPIIINGTQELAKNKVLFAAKKPMLGDKAGMTEYGRDSLKDFVTTKEQLPFLPLLKTWTDFVQIRALSCHHGEYPSDLIAVCVNDYCLLHTARMFGIPFVILSTATSVTLYCNDVYADEQFKVKKLTDQITIASKVFSNISSLRLKADKWFDKLFVILINNKEANTDPSQYLAVENVINMWIAISNTINKEIQYLKKMKSSIAASPDSLSDDCHQFLHLFPTTIDTWFSQFVSVETILSGIADTSEKIREHMTRLQGMPPISSIRDELKKRYVENAAAEWIGQYDSISALVDNAIDVETSLHLSQAYRACILLTTYREYPMSCDVNIMYQGLRRTLMLGLKQTKIRGYKAGSFVSKEQMVSLFLPDGAVSYKNLFIILRIAKHARWSPPQPSILKEDLAKQVARTTAVSSSTCNKVNALDVYHHVLRNPIIADRLENGLLTLWLLSLENLPFTCKDIIEMYNNLLNIQYRYSEQDSKFPFEAILLPNVAIQGYTRSIDSHNPETNAVKTTISESYLRNGAIALSAIDVEAYESMTAAAKAEADAARIAQRKANSDAAKGKLEENRNSNNNMGEARGRNPKKGGTRRKIANRRNRSNKKRK